MKLLRSLFTCAIAVLSVALLLGCESGNKSGLPVEEQVERAKPAPGTGNVQGKVVYNGKPIGDIEVKLCEKFDGLLSGQCSGQTFTAISDAEGNYLITDVVPMRYAVLTRVSGSDSDLFTYVSNPRGFGSNPFEVSADKTLFIPPIHFFKVDLKLLNPPLDTSVSGEQLWLTWEPYAEATYYRIYIEPLNRGSETKYMGQQVDGTSFTVPRPLDKGTYMWRVEGYSSPTDKIAESDHLRFTVE